MEKKRIRDFGIVPGRVKTGKRNAITDVPGVLVGHCTVNTEENHTGVTSRGSRRRYSSYRGLVGSTFENVIARDFGAEGPWQKLGTDVTEFKVATSRNVCAALFCVA